MLRENSNGSRWFCGSNIKTLFEGCRRIPGTTIFPLTVKTTTGWITLNPIVKRARAPEDRANQVLQPKHEDMSSAGLYTEREAMECEQLINFPVFHEVLSRSMSSGACENDETCQLNV